MMVVGEQETALSMRGDTTATITTATNTKATANTWATATKKYIAPPSTFWGIGNFRSYDGE